LFFTSINRPPPPPTLSLFLIAASVLCIVFGLGDHHRRGVCRSWPHITGIGQWSAYVSNNG
jgi:hypothetical protein